MTKEILKLMVLMVLFYVVYYYLDTNTIDLSAKKQDIDNCIEVADDAFKGNYDATLFCNCFVKLKGEDKYATLRKSFYKKDLKIWIRSNKVGLDQVLYQESIDCVLSK